MSEKAYEQVSALMDVVDGVTNWEYDFVMHMATFEEAGHIFSPEQEAKIEELHEKYVQ